MTSLLRFAKSGFTLHSLLSCMELFVLLSVIYAVVRHWQQSGKETLIVHSKNTLKTSLAMLARSGIPGLQWGAARLLSKSSTTLTRIEGKGKARYAPIAFVFVFCAVTLAVVYHVRPKIEYLKDVQVLQRINDYDFRYQIVDPDTREWNEFVWTGCHDYVPTREIQSGTTILWIKYVEDKSQSCQEIGWDNLGYKLWRDTNDHPILATFARQTATPRP
jgi:hypothetical protein